MVSDFKARTTEMTRKRSFLHSWIYLKNCIKSLMSAILLFVRNTYLVLLHGYWLTASKILGISWEIKTFDCVDYNKLWKILQEMGILDHLTCHLRNLYAGGEATVRSRHGTIDWFQTGKGVYQGCIFSPCLFNLYAEWASLIAQLVKKLPAMQDIPVWFLSQENPLEK